MFEVVYGGANDLTSQELAEFYRRVQHHNGAPPERFQTMIDASDAFVTARIDRQLIGLARGVSDGVRGYLTECKLDPQHQGPGAITRTDGRIEHDERGIAAEMARRVLLAMFKQGVQRVDVLAWGTEVDFLEELGFRRRGGLVGLTLLADEQAALRPRAAAGVVS